MAASAAVVATYYTKENEEPQGDGGVFRRQPKRLRCDPGVLRLRSYKAQSPHIPAPLRRAGMCGLSIEENTQHFLIPFVRVTTHELTTRKLTTHE